MNLNFEFIFYYFLGEISFSLSASRRRASAGSPRCGPGRAASESGRGRRSRFPNCVFNLNFNNYVFVGNQMF